jgi:hypothetical protein
MNPFSILFGFDVGQALNAALLICFFWIALAHPDKVRNPTGLHLAHWIFAVSIVLPAMARLFIADMSAAAKPGGAVQPMIAQNIVAALSPVCFIIAFILAIEAVSPRSNKREISSDGPGGG